MEAREYLERYRQAQNKADMLREKMEEARASYDIVGGPAFTEFRRAGISKPTERKVERAQRALEAWRAAQIHALEIRQNVFALIMALPCHDADVLIERYINLKTWEQVEAATSYSHCAVHKMHRRALQLVQDLIDGGALELLDADIDAYFSKYINTWHYWTCEEATEAHADGQPERRNA